jgi:hypothetical protein
MSFADWAVTISGTRVEIKDNSIKRPASIDNGKSCSFTVVDATGMASYTKQERVRLFDANGVCRFSGYIQSAKLNNLNPSMVNTIDITCYGSKWIADKDYIKTDYENELAGDIVSDLHNIYLAPQGISAAYAQRRDTSGAQWALGTLSNAVGTNNIDDGNLEIDAAGDAFTLVEKTTHDLNLGTTTGLDTSNDHLEISTQKALHLSGMAQQGINNNYLYYKIWQGSQSIATGDTFVYQVWISSSNPKISGGMDFVCSDGTTARDSTAFDQEGLDGHPTTDLSGYANDQWFSRSINYDAHGFAGKTISYVSIAQEGDANGQYDIWCAQCYLLNSSGGVKATFFDTSLSRVPTLVTDAGYSARSLTVEDAYLTSGVHYSVPCDISAAGIIRSSIVSWSQSMANTSDHIYALMESSLDDGATWQTCTNHMAIPHLIAGMEAPSNLLFRQTLNVAGPNPTIGPTLTNLTVSILPSYNASVVTTEAEYNGSLATDWDSQNHSGTMTDAAGDLTINGNIRDWAHDSDRLMNMTLFGGGTTDGIQQPNSGYGIRCDAQSEALSEQVWAGQWGDFVCEVDFYLADTVGNMGIVYRGQFWSSVNNCFAYNAYVNATGVGLAKGSNSSTPAFTNIVSTSVTFQTGMWYHLKVQAVGNVHKISVNDVLYITQTDTTYPNTSRGYIGLRHYNDNVSGGARHTGIFQNFGVLIDTSGTWTTNNISLNSLGTVGNSIITWNDDTPSNGTLDIQASINAGSTWTSCTKDAAIPILPTGTNVVGKNLLVRANITIQNANSTPKVHGISLLVNSGFSASGSRISPALSLDPVGIPGSTSLTWNGLQPTNTTLAIDVSANGTSWTSAASGASGSVAIPGITVQPDPIEDTFDSDTHTLYTSTARTGGSTGTWSFNTGASRIDASGSGSVLLYTGLSTKDVDIYVDMDTANRAGVVWRWTNASNFYELVLQDANASSSPNVLQLFKTVSGTRTQIGSTTAISFTRGMPYRIHLNMTGSLITASFDGAIVLTATDTALSAAGSVGLATATNGSSSAATFYNLIVQALGQSVVGQFLYTRVRMTSTDPTASPQIGDLTLSVRGPSIVDGSLIPSTAYSMYLGNSMTSGGGLDDLAKKSGTIWDISDDDDAELTFTDMLSTPAPWIITGDDMLDGAGVTLDRSADDYRNVQYITGLSDSFTRPEIKLGDGFVQTWSVSYPIQSINTLSVNGVDATFGIQDVDTGRDFYYKIGDLTFSQDPTAQPLDDSQQITISYEALVTNVSVELHDDDQILEVAATDGTNGIIAMAEDGGGLSRLAGLQIAAARLDQYALIAHTLTFTTNRDGLEPAQLAPVFFSQFGISDKPFLLTEVDISVDATQAVEYAVTATDGNDVTTWGRYLLDHRT